MGMLSFFKSIVSAEAMGDEIIKIQLHNYNRVIKALPNMEPHEWLAQTVRPQNLWVAVNA